MGKALFGEDGNDYKHIGIGYDIEDGCEMYFSATESPIDCWVVINIILAEDYQESEEVMADPALYPISPEIHFGDGICMPNYAEGTYY